MQFVVVSEKIMILVNIDTFFSFLGGVPAEAPYGSIFLFTTAGDRKRQKTTLARVQLEQHMAHAEFVLLRVHAKFYCRYASLVVLTLQIKIKNLLNWRALRARGVLYI